MDTCTHTVKYLNHHKSIYKRLLPVLIILIITIKVSLLNDTSLYSSLFDEFTQILKDIKELH